MSDQSNSLQSTSATDVKQLGIWAAIASLSYVFWICGGMEMVERLAYYGVRSVSSLYVTDAASNGGLGLRESELAIIFTIWALVQTFVPVLTGGISDRIGYKETIFASTVFKIMGYLLMAWFPTFWGFSAGAIVLAFGTGIFKPGLQGTIVKSTNRQNSSMAWGIFYQTVNIGGFLGPLLAAQLRQLDWAYVFYVCALIISLNFLLLLTYKEPDKEDRLKRREKIRAGEVRQRPLWLDALHELKRPVVIYYMILFSGFWFMLNAIWDVGPLFVRDWVDTTPMVRDLFGPDGASSRFFIWFLGMSRDGQSINPEGIININAMLIMLTCFIVAGLGGKLRATSAMALGTFLASAAMLIFAGFNYVWLVVIGIVCFSFGEMLSSPKAYEYMGNIGPKEKKAMYLGFSQFPLGIGWITESFIGPYLYGQTGSRETLARRTLADQGLGADQIAAVPVGEAFDRLVEVSGQTTEAVRAQLYAAHDIGTMWYLMGIVGIISALGMIAYGRWIYAMAVSDQKAPQPAQ